MNLNRPASCRSDNYGWKNLLLCLVLLLAFGCSGGGNDNNGGSPRPLCLDCSRLSGNDKLNCLIQNEGIKGCALPNTPAPPNAISSFSLVSPEVFGIIGAGTIDITVPHGTNVAALVAAFGVSGPSGGKVTVGGIPQSSGVTANNFTNPLTYAVIPAEGATNNYLVTVTIAPLTNIWTWVGGSNLENQSGTYGTKGMAAATNIPGARHDAVSWTDNAGNFWLFGGYGIDSIGTFNKLNDLWKFDGSNWTWISGSNLTNQPGTYGTKGIAATTNTPGARQDAVSWKDTSGNFWLFGGYGVDSNGSINKLNDLWKFDGSSWTWVSGSNLVNEAGNYGTKGTPATTNIPGARDGTVSWTDNFGNFWVFGGSSGSGDLLNDLWKFDGSNWTWVGGSGLANDAGNYGAKGIAASTNIPGARHGAVSWIDTSGNFWLFGGSRRGGENNDLWKFDGASWTWVSGSNLANQPGTYVSKGTAAATSTPGGRHNAVAWTDTAGNFWVFGGVGVNINGTGGGVLSDLWKYDGSNWTWVGGTGFFSPSVSYGPKGMATTEIPYARYNAVSWVDNTGNLWLFSGNRVNGSLGKLLNDFLLYKP